MKHTQKNDPDTAIRFMECLKVKLRFMLLGVIASEPSSMLMILGPQKIELSLSLCFMF